MKSYKDPSFQERVGRAAEAKRKALEHLRSRPPLDAAVVAERRASSLRREVVKADKAEARRALKDAAAAEAAAKAAIPPPPTEADRKAARDARYAARKNRK